jgi:hypothetical protein
MMMQTGWMKNVVLLASMCVSGFAAGCVGDLSTGEEQQELVNGSWVVPPGHGIEAGSAGGLGPLAVCRSDFDGGQQPGKLWQSQCNFGWGGQEKRLSTYQVLTANSYRWIVAGTTLPTNAVVGGDAGITANHATLGICQVLISNDGTWHPGKFYAGNCNIAWGGQELVVAPTGQAVQILVQ